MACKAAGGNARLRQRAKLYGDIGEGPMFCRLVVYRGCGEGPSGMVRDQGDTVCDTVCWWVLRRRDKRAEGPGPGRSETEEQMESRGDRYWRSRAYSR